MNFLITLKEFIFDWCKKITTIWESSFIWQYIKEKYLCLSFLQRKILHGFFIFCVLISVFYFPLSLLWDSWANMREFRNKKHLVGQLNNLSAMLRKSQSSLLSQRGDWSTFIKRRVSYWSGAKNQLVRVQLMKGNWKKAYALTNTSHLKKVVKKNVASDKIKKSPSQAKDVGNVGKGLFPQQMVQVEMDNLNIKEVVRYGRRLEKLSPHFKLLGLNMEEDKEQENYFDVSYALAVFKNKEPVPSRKPSHKKTTHKKLLKKVAKKKKY